MIIRMEIYTINVGALKAIWNNMFATRCKEGFLSALHCIAFDPSTKALFEHTGPLIHGEMKLALGDLIELLSSKA